MSSSQHPPNLEKLAQSRNDFRELCVLWINENASNSEGNKFLTWLLFSKSVSRFEGLTLLALKGHNDGASIILRSLFESVVFLIACMKDEKAITEYLAKGERDKLKLFNKVNSSQSLVMQDLVKGIEGNRVREIKASVKELDSRRSGLWNFENYCRTAGLHDWYVTFYSIHSNDVHVTPTSLEKGMVVGSDGEIEKIELGRNFNDTCRNIAAAGWLLATAFHHAQLSLFGKANKQPSRWATKWAKLADDDSE
jgi:uncharacterized protein DUF5677